VAVRISAIYLTIGWLWIVVSDWFSFPGAHDTVSYFLATAKGLCFIAVTAFLLFLLIRRDMRFLLQSEERFRLLVERAPDAVLVQCGGRVVYANVAALRMLGASYLGQLMGKNVLDLVHPSSRESVRDWVASVVNNKMTVLCQEETFARLDGMPVVCEISAVPIRFDDQDGSLVFVRDATERKTVAERMANEQRMSLVRELAGGLAHELNNLIQVINGNAELARASIPESSPAQKHMDAIIRAGNQIAEWMSRVKAFSTDRNAQIKQLNMGTQTIELEEGRHAGHSVAPSHSPPLPDRPAPARTELAVDATGSTQLERLVLLAEDDEMVRSLTEQLLRGAGYSVLAARDGVEAVAIFETNVKRISAIILDVVMPRMGGFEAYRRICAHDANVPVIFASGFSGFGTPPNIELIPGENYLQKPFERCQLLDAVDRAVRARRATTFA